MNSLFTSTCTALLGLSLMAPAYADDGYAGSHAHYQDILIPLSAAIEEMDLTKPGKLPAYAMLLPAIQKVREAVAQTQGTCSDPAGGEGDVDCAAKTLSAIIIDSRTGRDGSPGLLELLATASKKAIKEAKIIGNASRQQGAPGAEYLLVGILIGLLQEAEEQGITDPKVLEPIMRAIVVADEFDPGFASAKQGKKGSWNLKENNKA